MKVLLQDAIEFKKTNASQYLQQPGVVINVEPRLLLLWAIDQIAAHKKVKAFSKD